MPKQKKANQATKQERLNTVYNMLVSGATRYQILQYVSQKTEWKITPRMVDNYIQEANAMLAQEAEFLRPREMGRAVARMNFIFQASLKVQDYQRAIAAARELNQLLGLYAPTTSELKLTGDSEILLTRILAELEGRGMAASDVFTALLNRLVEVKQP